MEHHFKVEIAQKYGVNCAIILNNLHFWVEKNRANEKHYHDGKYWTYNSKKAFTKIMPYMTERQIDYAMQKLIDEGVVITGNYNEMAYDRTLWYAITDFGYSILQNCEMERTNLGNGFTENVKPIPYNKPDSKTTDKNTYKKKESKSSFDAIISAYAKDNEEVKDLLSEWLKVRKAKRAAMTDRAIQMNIDKLDNLAAQSNLSVTDYLKEVICRGWAAFYAINNYSSSKPAQPAANNNRNKQLEKFLTANNQKVIEEDMSLYEGL